jgi:hypothetical protein
MQAYDYAEPAYPYRGTVLHILNPRDQIRHASHNIFIFTDLPPRVNIFKLLRYKYLQTHGKTLKCALRLGFKYNAISNKMQCLAPLQRILQSLGGAMTRENPPLAVAPGNRGNSPGLERGHAWKNGIVNFAWIAAHPMKLFRVQ